MKKNNTCKHNWKEYSEYAYWITDDEPCFMPIFKCTKCGQMIKGEDLSDEELDALTPPVEWIPWEEL